MTHFCCIVNDLLILHYTKSLRETSTWILGQQQQANKETNKKQFNYHGANFPNYARFFIQTPKKSNKTPS